VILLHALMTVTDALD